MNQIEELKNILETDLLVELKDSIIQIEKVVKKQQHNKDAKIELQNMQDLQKDFNAVLEDIENDDVSIEEATEILEELENMKMDNQEV